MWQARLQLHEWRVSIVMSHPADLRRGTMGNIRWDLERKTAVIRVLDGADYDLPPQEALKDQEMTVVHELIHLELALLPRTDASRGDEEVAVDRMAEALLKLDRLAAAPSVETSLDAAGTSARVTGASQ